MELSEWTTLKYEYENVIVSRTNKTLPLPGDNDIKYAETIKLIEYSGYLKAGTNLKEIQRSQQMIADKTITKIIKNLKKGS